jgi:excisionase family DNA binding protein
MMTTRDAGPENGFAPRIGRSVSLDHAAQLLGVSRRTIYNRIRDGRLQTIRTLGGSQRVLLDSVSADGGGRGAERPEPEALLNRRPAC